MAEPPLAEPEAPLQGTSHCAEPPTHPTPRGRGPPPPPRAALAAQAGARPAVAPLPLPRALRRRARRCRGTIGKERPPPRRARPLSREPRSTPCRSRRPIGSTPLHQGVGSTRTSTCRSRRNSRLLLVKNSAPPSPVRPVGGMGLRCTSRSSRVCGAPGPGRVGRGRRR